MSFQSGIGRGSTSATRRSIIDEFAGRGSGGGDDRGSRPVIPPYDQRFNGPVNRPPPPSTNTSGRRYFDDVRNAPRDRHAQDLRQPPSQDHRSTQPPLYAQDRRPLPVDQDRRPPSPFGQDRRPPPPFGQDRRPPPPSNTTSGRQHSDDVRNAPLFGEGYRQSYEQDFRPPPGQNHRPTQPPSYDQDRRHPPLDQDLRPPPFDQDRRPPPFGQDRRPPPFGFLRPPPPSSNTSGRQHYDDVRNNENTPLYEEDYRQSSYAQDRRPPPGQNHRPTQPPSYDQDRQPPPFGQDLRPPPSSIGRGQAYDQREQPPTSYNQNARPEPAYDFPPRGMPNARDRPQHDYRSTVPSTPVPSRFIASDPRNNDIEPEHPQENHQRACHNYFEAPSQPPTSRPPPFSNDDGYQNESGFPSSGNTTSSRGGYFGASNPRGGYGGAVSGRGGYGSGGRGGYTNGYTSTRNDFTGTDNNGRNGNDSAPRSNRYDDRRNSGDAPQPFSGYRGFQQLDSQSTQRARAPKNYVPQNRDLAEIFNEDSQDINRHANTIYGDAEVDVLGEEHPQRCEHWNDMQLHQSLLTNIRKSEYKKPRNIQQSVIPYIMEGYNIKCQSETGSGKTAAFLIPLIDNLIRDKQEKSLSSDGPVCLIISPTRELTHQLYEQAKKFADGTGITVSFAYGQIDTGKNLADIRRGCNILVACLGRLIDLVESSHLTLKDVRYFVVDEADRFMDNRDEHNGILKLLNYPQLPKKENRQTLLFSATLKDPVLQGLVDEHIDSRKLVFIVAKSESNTRIRYQILAVPSAPAKFRYLLEYLKEITAKNNGECPRVLIFVNRKINVDRVAVDITNSGFPATTIHGDRGQDLREEALKSFKMGKTRCLVATDVCARGVDIKEMDYVINYDLPNDRTGFVQRCGRTGRNHCGVAMSFYFEGSDINMAEIIDSIIKDAGQPSPRFLCSGVTDSDYIYDEPAAASTNTYSRRETDRSPASDQHDSGYSRNASPYEEQQQQIPDNNVDDEWN